MSLVYDALRQQGDAALSDRPLPRASWSWSRLEPRLRTALLFGAGALVAAPLAFLARGAGDATAPAPIAAASTPAWTVPVSVDTAAPAAGADEPIPASFAEAVPAPALPLVAAAQPAPVSMPAPIVAIAAAQPAPIKIQVTQRTVGPAAAGGGGEAAVEQAIQAIQAAVAVDDGTAAREALARLESILHGDSLTLLRMRAWVAHESHDMGSAEQLYRQIAERVPDDVNAGINIARMDASRGRIDDARSRLLRLSGRHSRSPQVARALAELDAMPR